jgi:hypothetical protein
MRRLACLLFLATACLPTARAARAGETATPDFRPDPRTVQRYGPP